MGQKAGMGYEGHKACNKEHGGFTEDIEYGRGVTMGEEEQESLFGSVRDMLGIELQQ